MSSLIRRIQKKGAWIGVPGKGTPKRSGPPRGSRRGTHKNYRPIDKRKDQDGEAT